MAPTRVAPDVTAVRALAHPVRMRMLGLLRFDGPSTATRLAERLGLSSGVTSYHLRQLEQHGFIVEDAGRGSRRDRWWKAAHDFTWVDAGDTDAERDASDAFAQAALIDNVEALQRAVTERGELPDVWRHLSTSSDYYLMLTADQARELRDRLNAVMAEYALAHTPTHDGTPPDPEARPYQVQVHTFPRPGQLAPDGSDEPDEPEDER